MDSDHPHEACRTGCSHELLGRKGFLSLGASALAGAALLATESEARAAVTTTASVTPGAELILLGTSAGPPPAPGRAGIASALVIDGKIYVIDCGRASVNQFVNAGLEYEDVAGIFVTHLHADHVCDLYNFFLLGAGWPAAEKSLRRPVPVYGPGSAGLPLPPAFPPGRTVDTAEPDHPVPGLTDLMRHCTQAYAYSINVFMRDTGVLDISRLMDVREIALPPVGAHPLGPTAPPMAPVTIAQFGDVTVTGLLVPHGACFPAYAYRFDTPHGSIVFSGDTTPTPNLIALAYGADLLVHEAIALESYHTRGMPPAMLSHLATSHTDVADIGRIARAAQVKSVVLSHLAPGDMRYLTTAQWQALADRSARLGGYDGPITVGTDLARFDVRGGRTA
ncbi:MAG TPA: MBL fold metallo-hydrolase [Candidatus Sulfotelmatobacter sp.]|nr:MBL fold metallo-hydrolase [Candidatus Sulfotelmatobacter sp.]